MGTFKSLVDKVQEKKDELEKRAARKAAETAAEVALARGKEAALSAVEQAGRTLRSAGASLEEALFGPESEAEPAPEAPRTARPARPPAIAPEEQAARRVREEERFQREVDDELAALKRKIARQ